MKPWIVYIKGIGKVYVIAETKWEACEKAFDERQPDRKQYKAVPKRV